MQQLVIACMVLLLSITATVGGSDSHVSEPQRPFKMVKYEKLDVSARKQVDCLADNMYFEAGNQPQQGQVAVGLVTMNRVNHDDFPKTVCGVVRQTTKATCQFSWWCNAKSKTQALRKEYRDWDTYKQIRELAIYVFLNYNDLHDVTQGALFYHAEYVPRRALGVSNLRKTAHIGQHIFYGTRI